jgi:hypothetical protein
MVEYHGFDSVTPTHSVMSNGQTLAVYAYNFFHNRNAAAAPSFWARYFSPSIVGGTINTGSQASTERTEMNGVGIHRIVPICAPGVARLTVSGSTGFGYGQADGEAFCDSIDHVLAPGGVIGGYGVNLPTTADHKVYVYLDVEQSTRLTQSYWDGWAQAVFNHPTAVTGSGLPFYPGAYCNPPNGLGLSASGANVNVCQVLGAHGSGQANSCWALWSNQPESISPCSTNCLLPGPAWAANSCAGIGTAMWQFAETPPCGPNCYPGNNPTYPPVDLDKGYPSQDNRYFMLWC